MQKIKNFKLFNVRPFVFGLAAMIAGVFLAFSFFVSFWFLIGFAIAAIVVVGVAIRRNWFAFFKSHLTVSIIVLVCFVVGIVSMSLREGVYRKNVAEEGIYYFAAKAAATTKYEDDLYRTKISGVTLFDAETKKQVIKLNESVYVWTKTSFEIGDKISFVGYYKAEKHNSIFDVAPQKAYTISVYSAVNVSGNSKTIFEKYKTAVWKSLSENMDESAAGTTFAMLCGDSSKVEQETKENYRAAGVGHILAVSGLHVGFFVLLLSFLLNLMRVNKKVGFAIIFVLLSLFCWLCGFSYSVVRASIMSVVLLYAGLRGKQYDGLSALAFATILILMFDPYQLFTASFLLSFFSVFTIFCLNGWLRCGLEKLYPKKFASSLALAIVASIAILPWQVYFFGYFCTLGILLNLVAIPLVSVAFMFGFVVAPLASIVPQLGFLLKIPSSVLFIVDGVCGVTSQIPFSIVSASISPVTIAMWYLAVVLCSDYIFLPRRAKMWTRIGSAAAALVLFGLNVGGVF